MPSKRAEAAEAALGALTQRQLNELLDTFAGVRTWLGGQDPQDPGAGALLTSKEAGEILDVERQRLWRWEKGGKIARVATNGAGPLFMRVDVEELAASPEVAEGRRRREAAEA